MNVLHAPVNVGSQASSLARAENEARRRLQQPGRSWSVDFEPNTLVSDADETFPSPPGLAGKIHRNVRPFLYGLRHVTKFQVLHLYFGKSLLSPLGKPDLPLWKALGKTVFATFQGCDARFRQVMAERPFSPCQEGVCDVPFCNAALDKKRERWTRQMTRWADKLFAVNPDLVPLIPGAEYLPYATMPTDLPEKSREPLNRPPRIVHAPSNRSIKGTAVLLHASEQLQATHPHELQLVEGVPREQALRIYAEADILVDQVRLGWYGGLALEAMAMGVPTVAYISPDSLAEIPPQMRAELPIMNATPETLPEELARLLESISLRKELSRRGPDFVRRWHHPERIGRRMLELYADPKQSFWEGYDVDGC